MTDDHDVTEKPGWDADAYDESHSYVHQYGESVVEWLDPEPDERILDVGCGTGHLTAEIAAEGATAVGIDASSEMIGTARENYPDLSFCQVDARELDHENPFDAVFSNAALHWIPAPDHEAVLDRVSSALVDGGRFVAEMGGTGNVEQIASTAVQELRSRGYDAETPWYFPGIHEYTPRLAEHGLEPRRAVLFDRPTELDGGQQGLRNWLEMFGDSIFAGVPDDEQAAVIESIENQLREDMFEEAAGTWVADYRRLRFVAVRQRDAQLSVRGSTSGTFERF